MRVAYDALKPLGGPGRAGVLEQVAAALNGGDAATGIAPDRAGPYERWASGKVLDEVDLLEEAARGRVLRWLPAVLLQPHP